METIIYTHQWMPREVCTKHIKDADGSEEYSV